MCPPFSWTLNVLLMLLATLLRVCAASTVSPALMAKLSRQEVTKAASLRASIFSAGWRAFAAVEYVLAWRSPLWARMTGHAGCVASWPCPQLLHLVGSVQVAAKWSPPKLYAGFFACRDDDCVPGFRKVAAGYQCPFHLEDCVQHVRTPLLLFVHVK